MGYAMVAFLGLYIAAMAAGAPIVAIRSAEHGQPHDAAVAVLASIASWGAVYMFGPAWVAVMLTLGVR